ncbi:MAG: hypothetical protein LQ349_004948 [Xanthoria aureola]|nr:MAG: hypothetical protein LQ349_004948 [Xanthoria aureola]
MAFPQPYQTPDLAAVLQTLAACAPPRPPIRQTQEDDLEEGEYDPTEFHPIIPAPAPPSVLTPYPPQPYNEHNRPQIQDPQLTYSAPTAPESHTTNLPPTSPAPPHPSPQPPQPSALEKASTLTTYAPALRHTTHLLSTSPATAARIRHLIHTAHTHERQWWSGRQSLLHQLSTRSASRQKLNSVLASIGGLTSKSETDPETPVDDVEKEVKMYDRKVHKAYAEMVKATHADLGKLGIPFFCIREALVVRGGEGGEKGTVGEKELGVLRGRMLGFLEDWVREEV